MRTNAAVGNTKLTDFDELREVVLFHAKAVEHTPTTGLKQGGSDQTLGVFME